jgi:SAM-dependent methyltransferase
LAHPRLVDEYIHKTDTKNVLELATGRGGNSLYLANRNSDIKFYGIDLSPGQLYFAHKNRKGSKNYIPEQGDYSDLSRYQNDFFDVIFIVEALCHSTEKAKVLGQVFQKLKKGGYFIIFDAYRSDKELDASEIIACELIEKGMAVEIFETYSSLQKAISKTGFQIVYEEDVSQYIIPTLEKLARLARKFVKMGFFARIISKILPKAFLFNVAPAYLMPTIMRDGIGEYKTTVLQKS